jgi:type IV pilus assembly protein PilM
MFLNPFPYAFGLDIGDLSIKAVALRNTTRRRLERSFEITALRSTRLPHGLIVNGVIEEPEKVRKYISHLLTDVHGKEKPIRSQWVVATLPDIQAFLKRIDIDKDATDVIEEDVFYAAKRHIPFGEDEYYIDWQMMPPNADGKASVLVGAVPKRIADIYTYLLESMDLGVVGLEIEAVAVARTMITAKKSYEGEARGILNLGATRSSFTVFDHDQIQFSVSLPFSGEAVTQEISRQCHVSYETAEQQKLAVGLEYKKEFQTCWSSVTGMTEHLTNEIQKAMQYYATHFPNANKITHITMCGGGATMKRLDRILSLKLKTTARPGNVWKNLSAASIPKISLDDSLRYAAAVGLAMRAATNPFFTADTV